jgi:hypothetical protein
MTQGQGCAADVLFRGFLWCRMIEFPNTKRLAFTTVDPLGTNINCSAKETKIHCVTVLFSLCQSCSISSTVSWILPSRATIAKPNKPSRVFRAVFPPARDKVCERPNRPSKANIF